MLGATYGIHAPLRRKIDEEFLLRPLRLPGFVSEAPAMRMESMYEEEDEFGFEDFLGRTISLFFSITDSFLLTSTCLLQCPSSPQTCQITAPRWRPEWVCNVYKHHLVFPSPLRRIPQSRVDQKVVPDPPFHTRRLREQRLVHGRLRVLCVGCLGAHPGLLCLGLGLPITRRRALALPPRLFLVLGSKLLFDDLELVLGRVEGEGG